MTKRAEKELPLRVGLLGSIVNRGYRSPHAGFQLETDDKVSIAGVHLSSGHPTLVVFCHGFLGSKTWRAVPGFVDSLTHDFDVMAFDFRGHGQSGGKSTVGCAEVQDLRVVIRYARAKKYERVVLVGESLGGAVAIRYGGLHGEVEGIVTINAFASLESLFSSLARYPLWFMFNSALGRSLVSMVYGTRLGDLPDCQPPLELVHRVSPIPLFLIQGGHDPFVKMADGKALYSRAREPKELRVVSSGHAFMLHEHTRTLIVDWIRRMVVDAPVVSR